MNNAKSLKITHAMRNVKTRENIEVDMRRERGDIEAVCEKNQKRGG